jgi:APA family basic amino acid/polyamine antiporter
VLFWAYDGWVNVTYIAGEVKNSQRNIPIAIILGTASVMLLYLLLNMSFLRVMSAADYAALDAQGRPNSRGANGCQGIG